MTALKITTVTYKAVINLGSYEAEHIEITAEVAKEDGSVANVIDALRAHVEAVTLKRGGWMARGRETESPKPGAVDPFTGFED